MIYRLIDMEQQDVLCSDMSWKKYNDLTVLYKWLDKLIERYPKIVTEYVYGRSYENRPLRAVKVSHRSVCIVYRKVFNFYFKLIAYINNLGKSNHFHSINNSCTRMDISRYRFLLLE